MTLASPGRGYPLERLEGSSGSMAWWSRTFTRVADTLSGLRDAAQSAADLPGVGASVTSVRVQAGEVRAVIAPDIAEAELLSGVIQRYADAYDASATRANGMIEDIESAHAEWSRLNQISDSAGRAAMYAAYGDDKDESARAEQAALAAVSDRIAAKEALDALWLEYEGYYSSWDEAYDTALAELAAGAGQRLTSQSRDLLDDLLAADGPEDVLALWNAHPELHDELAGIHPDIIGNLDGIPWDVRATANEARLESLRETEPPGPRRDQLEAIWDAIQTGGVPTPHLISFDPSGSEQVTAALAHGDLATATEINTLIPGMDANVADLHSWGESAKELNASVGDGSATVVWFGYDTPSLTEEPGMSRAEDGAAALRTYLQGLGALSPNADINVIAHSYGSTTAALAIGSSPDGLGVTSLITVGSAGFPNDPTVVENLTNGTGPQIYSTISEDDWVARVGRGTAPNHPISPETLTDVTAFDSDGGVGADGASLPASTRHDALGPGAYLQPGSESFYNISEIIQTGQPGTERGGEGSTQGFWDADHWWISDEYAFIDF